MGCEVDQLMLALSTRTIQAGVDSIVQRLTLQQVFLSVMQEKNVHYRFLKPTCEKL